jgi:hypothetical protein
MANPSAPKIMVAVHGVGDQLTNETVRTVAAQVCRYYDRQGAESLGAFPQFGTAGVPGTFIVKLPDGVPPDVGFAEVYWAGIARKVVKEGYVLEDARKWGKTIVARVQANGQGLSKNDCLLVENVLEELIDTVGVLDRLCFIAAKAGVFTFSLQRILDDFVNDVQLVADFQKHRGEVLQEFSKVMAAVVTAHKDAEIYLVAHSEGTVVMLTGLLNAIANPERQAGIGTGPGFEHNKWLDRVRGIMTIGSPLDTHMLLWPRLWEPLELAPGEERQWKPKDPILWHNYYDHGDPIADKVSTTEQWVNRHYPGTFKITLDCGFSRFYFPGKAHIDYWNDEHVFGHFIEQVMKLPAVSSTPAAAAATGMPAVPAAAKATSQASRDFTNKPPSKRSAQIVSYVAPYGLIGLLLFAAVFVLYRSVTDFLRNDPNWTEIVRDVGILAFLVGGTTIAVRMPRLTSVWLWRAVGAAVFLLSAAVYAWPILLGYPPKHPFRGMQDMVAGVFTRLGVPAPLNEWAFLIGAAGVVVVCALFGRSKHNRLGVRLLLGVGGVLVLVIVGGLLYGIGVDTHKAPRPANVSVWPVFLGVAGFFYLWWLAALLFDLVFVWHRYIRHSAVLNDLRDPQGQRSR